MSVQEQITPNEIEVIRDMQSIASRVGELKTSVDRSRRRTDIYLQIFVGTVVTLALASIALVATAVF